MPAQIASNNKTASEAATQVRAEEVHQILENIFRSKHFSHAPKKQKFIQLICDYYLKGQANELNEYLIGRDVFDRGDSYDPAADPIVRVGAHDVRKKLEQYYQNEGAADEIKLVIPVGTYVPIFVRTFPKNQEQSEEATRDTERSANDEASHSATSILATALESRPAKFHRKWLWLAGVLLALLFAAVVSLLWNNQKLRQQLSQTASQEGHLPNINDSVWELFLKNTAPTLLILSNPVVHRSATETDPQALTEKGISLTPEQAEMMTSAAGNRLPVSQDRPIRLIPAYNMYTGIGEAVGAYRLSNLLQAVGEKTILKQSRSIGADDLKQYDLVLLGSVYSNQWSKPLSIKENFVYGRHGTIENLNPRPGEEREYRASFDQRTGSLLEDYALITVTPGVSGDRAIMTLAGIYSEGTQAAAEFVTTDSSLNELNQWLKESGQVDSPLRYYQALLKVRVENSFPTKTTLVAIRELQVNSQ